MCFACAVLLWLLILTALAATFPNLWGPEIATAIANRLLPRYAPGARLRVCHLSPWQAVVADIHVGESPEAPSCASALLRYSVSGLRQGRVDVAQLTGLSAALMVTSGGVSVAGLEDLKLPASRQGSPALQWRVDEISLDGRVRAAAGGSFADWQRWLPLDLEARGAIGGETGGAWWLNVNGAVACPRLAAFCDGEAPAVGLAFNLSGVSTNLQYYVAAVDLGGAMGQGRAGRAEWSVGAIELRGGALQGCDGKFAVHAILSLTNGNVRAGVGLVSNLCLRLPFAAESDAAGGGLRAHLGDKPPHLSWERADIGGVALTCTGMMHLPVPSGAVMAVRAGVQAEGSVLAATTTLRVGTNGVHMAVNVPAVTLTERDGLWNRLKQGGRLPQGAGVLHLSGEVAGAASLNSDGGNVLRWQAWLGVSNGAVRVEGRSALSISGIVTRLSAGGDLENLRAGPVTTRFEHAQAAGLTIDGGILRWQWLDDYLLIESAELRWCEGRAQLYALRLRPDAPDLDFVLYLDRLDAGQVLKVVKPLHGAATGHLYGRLPVRVRRGRVRLSEGYLFAMPGETGTLQLDDTGFIEDYLKRAGMSYDVRKQVSSAMRSLDYDVLRFDLTAGGEPEARLALRVEGRSSRDRTLPPVTLDLNLHGPIETLLNLGLQMNKGGRRNVE
ncbi:MAG: YdbH domain-containing protein [Kiritimatiellae bacterium]|nr:YdbH domain-containing protein [Kiritimatiellia bacterium]